MPSRQSSRHQHERRARAFSYLDDLEDPQLPVDRHYTLTLMLAVARSHVDRAPFPPAADPTRELQEILDRLLCPNCMKPHRRTKIFCGDQCEQEAQAVRQIRKRLADGRIAKSDCQEGIGQKLIQIVAGGYPSARKLDPKLRNHVLDRDKRICQICQKPGNQIDHIEGSANDPPNLRVLCASCNRGRVLEAMRPSTSEDVAPMRDIFSRLALRIAAPQPIRLCDSEEWRSTWGFVRTERRRLLQELDEMEDSEFEDVDGYLTHAMGNDD